MSDYLYCIDCNIAFDKHNYFNCNDHTLVPLNDPAYFIEQLNQDKLIYWQQSFLNTVVSFHNLYSNRPYKWDITNNHNTGTVKNIIYQNFQILHEDKDHCTHCSGVTFNIFVETWNKYNKYSYLSVTEMKQLKKYFFAQIDNHTGIAQGFAKFGIGRLTTDISEAEVGDFCQLYHNKRGIGHCMSIIGKCKTFSRGKLNNGLLVYTSNSTTNGMSMDFYSDFEERGFLIGKITA